MIYQIKYNNHPELATYLGEQYGTILRGTMSYHDVDYIIPIPLHSVRQRKRGYNQANYFAKGLSISMGRPVLTDILIRKVATPSQTSKSRTDRYDNVEGIFEIMDTDILKEKTILLVDDVLTTGATLASAVNTLQRIEAVRISIATLARRK